jgi:hypothetical protein
MAAIEGETELARIWSRLGFSCVGPVALCVPILPVDSKLLCQESVDIPRPVYEVSSGGTALF